MLASQRPTSAPLVDAVWVRSWLEAFAPTEPVVLATRDDGRLVGLAALQRMVESQHGRPVRVLQSLTNEESFRFDFLSHEGRSDILERMWRVLCDPSRWDVIRLHHLPEGSPTLSAALAVARERGWRALVRETFLTPWRPLCPPAPWDEGLTRKFKSNLRRRERRLGELGALRCDIARGGRTLQLALESFYELEARGWKGHSRSAVAQRPPVKRFYDRLVERAAADGGVWIPVLTLSDTPIAAQVLRISGRTMFGLKTAYDEAYARYGPGQVLTSRVIRYGLDHGMEALDLMAGNATYKADWARRFLAHHELLLFAPSLAGRYAYWVRYGVREQVKKLPGAVQLARWLRTGSTYRETP
jgi:CelD/BcsL family acetyltransferase involved in cellulose biosynthesis